MTGMLEQYESVVGENVIDQLRQLTAPLSGMRVVHVNSTREGGGVAEILHRLVPLKQELGLDVDWEVVTGDDRFYECTKKMHNTLQGEPEKIPESLLEHYLETNRRNAERLRDKLEQADVVFIHDPQPAPLLGLCPGRRGKWVWRCHIDISRPNRSVWKFLQPQLEAYDASIYSLAAFARRMPHPLYIIAPSIDPLSAKNMDLGADEVAAARNEFGIDPERPVISQISRFDRWKDPVGVIRAWRMVRDFGPPVQLVMAGGTATDDPEGEQMLAEVRKFADNDPDVHILLLPPDAHRSINAIQRFSSVVLQKSIREGFGLTVTEAMWKGKPVIGGNVGGIRLQVVNHHTGFLVDSPEGAALRIRYLLKHGDALSEMGNKARTYVRDNFLLTRHLREYLTLMVAAVTGSRLRVEL
ncbi:MAG: glycosyltransferase [Desulfatibacillaceae bacterium]